MKQYAVKGIVTRAQTLGSAIRRVKEVSDCTPEEEFLRITEGIRLFKGKISDVLREVRGGFNFGKVLLTGIGDFKGKSAYVEFQNENLTAAVEGHCLPRHRILFAWWIRKPFSRFPPMPSNTVSV